MGVALYKTGLYRLVIAAQAVVLLAMKAAARNEDVIAGVARTAEGFTVGTGIEETATEEAMSVAIHDKQRAASILQKFVRDKLYVYTKGEELTEERGAKYANSIADKNAINDAINTSNQDTKSATMQGIKKFGKGAAAISLGVGTGMGMTSFGADLAKAINPKDENLQMILGIASEVTATILAIAGGIGLSKLSNLTESVTKDQFSFFKKLMPNMDSIDERQMSRTALILQAGAAVTQASGEVGNALQEIKTAEITADIQERQAIVQELDEMEKMNNKNRETEEARMQTIMKGFQKTMADIQNAIVAPAQALVRALSESV